MARAVDAEWETVGSELEALLREVTLIAELAPVVNVQTGPPALQTREVPRALLRDLIVVVPSVDEESAELVAVRADGPWMIQRTRRDGADLAVHTSRLMRFFHSPLGRDRVRRSSPAAATASRRRGPRGPGERRRIWHRRRRGADRVFVAGPARCGCDAARSARCADAARSGGAARGAARRRAAVHRADRAAGIGKRREAPVGLGRAESVC